MGSPVVADILMGPVVLWYAPVGEAHPDESVSAGTTWGGNWTRFGFTSKPLTAAYSFEEVEVKPQESLAPVKRRKKGEGLVLETELHELTATYLGIATHTTPSVVAAGAGQHGYEEIAIGGDPTLDEYAWGFEGTHVTAAGLSEPMRVFLYKGTAKLSGKLEFSKEQDGTGIPFQVDALADWSTGAERLFKFQRVTAEPTA